MKIKNIEDLQMHVIHTLERLDKGEIDIDEASIVSKGAESVNSSIKLQLAYNNMRGETPNIPFLQICNKGKVKEIDAPKAGK